MARFLVMAEFLNVDTETTYDLHIPCNCAWIVRKARIFETLVSAVFSLGVVDGEISDDCDMCSALKS
jgi:hypothetical protein